MQGNNFDATQLSVLAAPAKSLLLRDYQVIGRWTGQMDRIWFFFNHRRVDSADAQPGIFANKNAGDPTKFTYVPDFTRQGRIDQSRKIYSLRLTTQITPRNKLCCSGTSSRSAAARPGRAPNDDRLHVATRTAGSTAAARSTASSALDRTRRRPATTRHAPEGAAGEVHVACHQQAPARGRLRHLYLAVGIQERPGNPTKNLVRVQEQSGADLRSQRQQGCRRHATDCLTVGGNLKYRSSNWPTGYIFAHTWNAAASYVTGAHNMKFGYQGAYHRTTTTCSRPSATTTLMQLHVQHAMQVRRAERRCDHHAAVG